MAGYIGLIAKATRSCNLRCTYCHDWKSGPDQAMSFSVLANMTARALTDSDYGAVEFIWHGGEPTLMPRSFFERAVYLQARMRKRGQSVRNSIQSNGTRIDQEWATFLSDHNFEVSLSLDGPPAIHDRYRVHASGKPSFNEVKRSLDILRDNGIRTSVLMVIDIGALELGAEKIFNFFLAEGITSYGLLAARPTNRPQARSPAPAEHYIAPAAWSRFLCDYFDRWLEHGDPQIHVRELNSLLRRLGNQSASVCTMAGGCFGRYFLVEPQGDIAHCDLFIGDPAYTLGNVLTDSFSSISSNPRLKSLRAENDVALRPLRNCPNFEVCNGWCPHERYVGLRHDPEFTDRCCGLDDVIEPIRQRIPIT